MEWRDGEWRLTDDRERMDVDVIYAWLRSTYWAFARTRETVERSLRHSLCFGMFEGETPAGFARVITDYATHAYLCDVFVAEVYRGRGRGRWMLERVLGHPELATVRMDLFTKDAHGFYRAYGFGRHAYDCLVRYAPDYAGGSDSSIDSPKA